MRNSSHPEEKLRLDRIDRNILAHLQRDATISISDLADKVGLSSTPCWRRIQKLEESGIIKRRIAVLDRRLLNAKMTVFIAVKASGHSIEWIENFKNSLRDMPEIVDIYRMSGEIDYLLRAFLPDMESYDDLYKKIIKKVDVTDVTSMFSMEEIKSTTEIPLDFM